MKKEQTSGKGQTASTSPAADARGGLLAFFRKCKDGKTKHILDKTMNVVLWVFLAFSVVMTILAFTAQASGNGSPSLGGKMMMFVKSDSMEGPHGFYTGDMIIGRVLTEAEKSTLQVGDVITFMADLNLNDNLNNKELNTHRIVEVVGSEGNVYYRTQGDNVEYVDPVPVYPSDVVAIWEGRRVPVVGSILGFLQSKVGFLICVVIPLFIFFLYKLLLMIQAILQYKNENRRAITADEEEEIKRRAIEEYLAKQKEAENANASENDTPKQE